MLSAQESLLAKQPQGIERDRVYVLTTRIALEPIGDVRELMGYGATETPALARLGFTPNHNSTVWERRASDGGLDSYVVRVSHYPFGRSPSESAPQFVASVINPLIRREDANEIERHISTVQQLLGKHFRVGEVKSSTQESLAELETQF